MLNVLIGDLFASQAQTLVNTVNCVGVMGKGVAQEFKKRWPAMFAEYAERCQQKQVRPGRPYVYDNGTGKLILNFPTKDHWRSPSKLADIETGLDWFVQHAAGWGITSVAFPPLGCGNGGLEWAEVGPMMYAKLSKLNIPVEMYAPYGTPKTQLTADFLGGPSQMELLGQGRKHEKSNPEWVVLVEVLHQLEQERYASPVGRTIFQKICYVLTEMGVQTGFQFTKGSYGPFADEVKLALTDLANRNWVQEQPLGQMIALHTGPQYVKDRSKHEEIIHHHGKKIAKTVDLFSRIKNTEQAEEVLTVLFASRQLKQAQPEREVAEMDIFNFILDWKKTWRAEEKKQAVARAIRNLVMLGWMRLEFSRTLPDAA